ncbi:MAG: His/Gly/Thr/Pro-type tRNA ligase C-terminal domain-containing protein, partial [Streptococcus thermophilus]
IDEEAKLEKQWSACEKDQIPFAIIVGKDELESGKVRIKDMRSKDDSQGGGSVHDRKEMITEIKRKVESL